MTKLETWLEKNRPESGNICHVPQAVAVIEKLKEALEYYEKQTITEEDDVPPYYTYEDPYNRDVAYEALTIDPEEL